MLPHRVSPFNHFGEQFGKVSKVGDVTGKLETTKIFISRGMDNLNMYR